MIAFSENNSASKMNGGKQTLICFVKYAENMEEKSIAIVKRFGSLMTVKI